MKVFSLLLLLTASTAFGQEEPPPEETEAPPTEDPGPTEPPPPPCEGEFYEPKGSIESPDYPQNYPNKRNCIYRILTNNYINLYFESFDVEESEDCTYDFLNIVFNATSRAPDTNRYCGSGLDKVNGGHLRGHGPLIVGFVSDDSDNMKGFRFDFEFELEGPDPCESGPCQHEGECQRFTGYYKCACPDGYAGFNCEIDKDECASIPCQNGGECVDDLDGYTCQCINDFDGSHCEIAPEPCLSDPCQNGGLCVDRVTDYVCSCPSDFYGDHCENSIPTPPPPSTTTTTTVATTTTLPEPGADSASTTEPPPGGGDGAPTDPTDSKDPGGDDNVPPPTDNANNTADGTGKHSNSALIAAIVIIVIIALILAAIFLWYWWKFHRGNDIEETKAPLDKEVTLINMKTNSEHGENKEGKRHSRTTSINSVTMKGNSKSSHDQLLHKLKRMSAGIIMEEVPPEPQRLNTFNNSTHPQQVMGPTSYPNPNVPHHPHQQQQPEVHSNGAYQGQPVPPDQSPLKRISVPVSQNEMSQLDKRQLNEPFYASPTQGNYYPAQYVSPDAAVRLFNQMKQTGAPNFDIRNAVSQFGPNDYTKNPYGSFPPRQPVMTVANVLQPRPPAILPPTNNPMPFKQTQLPHTSMPMQPSPLKPPRNHDANQTMELSPEEAAGVVNHILSSKPRNSYVTTQEAMDILDNVRKDLYGKDPPPLNREKSVFLRPHEVAKMMNSFHKRPRYEDDPEPKNETTSFQSSYGPSDTENRHRRWNRDFRECTPIREETGTDKDADDHKPKHEPQHNKPSKIYEPESKEPTNHDRLRKRPKRFPSARTLDPDEKVHDWLKNSPKFKKPGYKPRRQGSPTSTVPTETYTVLTRPMPSKQGDHKNGTKGDHASNDDGDKSSAMVQRTIRQTRRVLPDNKPMLPITENKAKSLVEKLIKAPARSKQNVVGPGLTVERENAFVGDGAAVDYF